MKIDVNAIFFTVIGISYFVIFAVASLGPIYIAVLGVLFLAAAAGLFLKKKWGLIVGGALLPVGFVFGLATLYTAIGFLDYIGDQAWILLSALFLIYLFAFIIFGFKLAHDWRNYPPPAEEAAEKK